MQFATSALLVMFALGAAHSYAILPPSFTVDGEMLLPIGDVELENSELRKTFLMRERRLPQGTIDFKASVGPGRTGSAGLDYSHQVWKGRNGQSLELGSNYMGQFGNGKPQHNFGIGGTFRF